MGGIGGGDRPKASTDQHPSPVPDEELKRTLERDTAVQGTFEEEGAGETHRPTDAGNAPRTPRPVPRADRSK